MRPVINDAEYKLKLEAPTLEKARRDAHRRGMHLSEHLRDLMRSYSTAAEHKPQRKEAA